MKLEPIFLVVGLLVVHWTHIASFPVPRPAIGAGVTGAAIEGWLYDSESNAMNVHIVNTGEKAITAFELNLTITDSAGHSSTGGYGRDFLNNVAALERFKGTPEEEAMRQQVGPLSIPPGGSYDEKVGVPPGFRDFSATLEAVAFRDYTVSGNKEAIDRLITIRKANAAAIVKATELIKKSATTEEAETAIQKYHDTYRATPHEKLEMQRGDLEGIIDDLKQLPDKAAVNEYVAAKDRERSMWEANSNLEVTP
jgi:hypothetical protein